MLGASFNSFLFRFPKTLTINVGMWGANNPDGSSLRWFEYTPFAVVVGWMVYYLVYVLSLLISGIKIMSDTAPLRTILVALIFGVVAAVFITIAIIRNLNECECIFFSQRVWHNTKTPNKVVSETHPKKKGSPAQMTKQKCLWAGKIVPCPVFPEIPKCKAGVSMRGCRFFPTCL
jgi:hypothetical protein